MNTETSPAKVIVVAEDLGRNLRIAADFALKDPMARHPYGIDHVVFTSAASKLTMTSMDRYAVVQSTLAVRPVNAVLPRFGMHWSHAMRLTSMLDAAGEGIGRVFLTVEGDALTVADLASNVLATAELADPAGPSTNFPDVAKLFDHTSGGATRLEAPISINMSFLSKLHEVLSQNRRIDPVDIRIVGGSDPKQAVRVEFGSWLVMGVMPTKNEFPMIPFRPIAEQPADLVLA